MSRFTPQQVVDAFRPWIRIFVSRLIAPPPGYVFGSWYRTEQQNDDAGGDFESQHRVGTGLDVHSASRPFREAPAWWAHELESRGLVVVQEGDHTHVQLWRAGVLARAGVRFDLLP